MRAIRRIRYFSVLVAVVFLLNSVVPNITEGSWLRTRQGHVTPQFWVDTSRYVARQVLVSPARTIPAVTEMRWVETAPARTAQGHWETTERRWVETVPAVPAQWGWRTVEVSPGRWDSVWVPPVTQSQWVQISPGTPAQWGWETVTVSHGYWSSVWVPPVTQQQWVQISPGTPAQGSWQTIQVSPGFWETVYEAIEVEPGYLMVVPVSRWVPPVTQQQWVETSPAQPAQWGWETVAVSPGHWSSVWVPPVTQSQWVQISPGTPAQWGWETVTVSHGYWSSVWVPPVTQSQWVQISPAVPAQGEMRDFVVATGTTPPAAQWQWVQTAPAQPGSAAQSQWRSVEVSPGRWENVWMPPITRTQLVQVSPAVPARTETRVVATHPGRWEHVFVPPVTRTETVMVSPGIPPIHETREVIVSPARFETRTIPAVTRTERVLIQPGREAVWEERTTGGASQWRWVETRPAIPARYETREIVVSPAQTVPAVTQRRWVQTSAAHPGQPAQGRWETVEVTPGRTERVVERFYGSPARSGASGRGYFEITREVWIPPVTETRWVETSPAVPAQAGGGYWETVVISEARTIPAVTRTEQVQVSPGVPAEGGWQLVTSGGVTQRILVVAEQAPVWADQEVVVTPARTETVTIPAVTRTETAQISPGAPAQYRTTETVVTPGGWETVWVPPTTVTETVVVSPAVPAVYEAVENTLPGRWESVWVPPTTEMRLVEVSPEVPSQPAQGRWELVTADPNRTTRWVETSPAVAAQWELRTVEVSPAVTIPEVTTTETVWTPSGHWQSLAGTITVERDREFVLTHRWRPDHEAFDMVLTVTHDLNREVTGIQAVHILDRFQGMGQMFVHPTAIPGGPNRHGFGFTYTHPGQPSSTVHITLHFAGGETFRFEMQIPVNGITVTQRRGVGPLDLQRAIARVGTITLP